MKKRNRKRLSLILSVVMVISLFSGMTIFSYAGETDKGSLTTQSEETDYSWYSTSETEFVLSTAEQLRGLAAIVNGTAEGIEQDSFAGKTVKLGADIALAEDGLYTAKENVRYGTASYAVVTTQYTLQSETPVWTPIGAGSATANSAVTGSAFAGTFDGQNHLVSGIYTGSSDASTGNTATVQGLFGIVSGTVKNVEVSGCITGSIVIGGIAADLQGGTIENCSNHAIIFADGGTTPGGNTENGISKGGAVGGITGVASGESGIKDCSNDASVVCTNTAKGGRVGGILGLVDDAKDAVTVTGNRNTGNVDGYQYVGGIAGLIYAGTSPVSLCSNRGTITGHSNSKVRVGGIVGECYSDISDCYNLGDFRIVIDGSAGDKAACYAGIVGAFSGSGKTIVNCYNAGARSFGGNATLESSCGTICGTGYGTTASTTLSNCYGLEGITGEDITNAQCVTVLSESELKGAASLLGENYTASEDGYPILLCEQETPSADTSWYQASEEEYLITTEAQLYGLAQIVNGTAEGIEADAFCGKTVMLGNDLDLSGMEEWTPIGTSSFSSQGVIQGEMPFEGIFDGQNHEIKGMEIEDENGGVALFGYSTGMIKNLSVSGTVTGNYFTAGVCAYGCGTFENVTSSVTVTAEGNCNGGILGDACGDVIILNCHNCGVITNNGVASEKSTGRVAGIVGRIDTDYTGQIINCSNTADITAYQYAAGIIGGCFGNVEIKDCYNSGTIRGISFGKVYIGGIAGKLGNGTIDSCYNIGALNHTPAAQGHVRAIGGIAGCEQDHTQGTAISNCYNAGTITLDTQHMVSGTNYIYMCGNISGGNSPSDVNTMDYQNCYYLENSFPAQNEDSSDYVWWGDVFKNNPLAYDTEDIISKTEEELKSEEMPSLLGTDFRMDPEGGYPVLYWQTGEEDPEEIAHSISGTVTGGSATLSVPDSAVSGESIEFYISDIEEGMQIRSITGKDASGASLAIDVNETKDYGCFVMPGRDVQISVRLERTPDESAPYYSVIMPSDLDAIWDTSMIATYSEGETAKAGSTVTIAVSKEQNALTSDLSGITVKTENGTSVDVTTDEESSFSGSRYYGEYSFTMPESGVSIDLDVNYTPLKICTQDGEEEAVEICSLSREEMEEITSSQRICYSGWSTETKPFIGVAETSVTLKDLMEKAGTTFEKGDTLKITGADGFTQSFSYEELYESGRKAYLDILEKGSEAEQTSDFEPCLVIKGNTTFDAEESTDSVQCDTLNTYRFVYGQTEEELQNHTKIVDSMPKCVVAMTVVHPKQEGELLMTEYGGDCMLARYVTDTLPEEGNAYYLGDTVLTLTPAYATGDNEGKYVFTAVIPASSEEQTVEERTGSYETAAAATGDINQDHKTNIIDAQIVMRFSEGDLAGSALTADGLREADVNASTTISSLDARAIQYFVHYGSFEELSN